MQRPTSHSRRYRSLQPITWLVKNLLFQKKSVGWFVFVFFCGDHGSRGWYDNTQPALRPVFIAAQCAAPCMQSVRMCGWCAATVVAIMQVLCLWELCAVHIYSAQPRLQVSLDARPLHPMLDRHRATQAHPPSQQGHNGLVLLWPSAVCTVHCALRTA